MRAERLLSIILLLQSHNRLTAAQLADRLDVSERTILRDMDALASANIPVYSERGRHGGWALVDGYRTNLIGISNEEISALVLSPSQVLADLGLDDAAEAATLKILASLPQFRRRNADVVRQRIHIDGAPWHGEADTARFLPQLQQAIWQDSELTIRYQRGDEEIVERTIAPLGLVAKGRIWYLIAAIDEVYRTYRVSRIRQVKATGKSITRPTNFDLADYWEQSTREFVAQLPTYPVTIRIHEDALRFIRAWRWATITSIAPDSDNWLVVEVNFEEIEGATACLLGCARDVQVIAPDELKVTITEKIRDLCS